MTEAEANKRNRRQARDNTRDQDVIGFGCFLTNHLQRTKGETKGIVPHVLQNLRTILKIIICLYLSSFQRSVPKTFEKSMSNLQNKV